MLISYFNWWMSQGKYHRFGSVYQEILYTIYGIWLFFLSFTEHQNYLGLDEKFGALAVSLRREKIDETCAMMKGVPDSQPHFQYRIIVRSSEVGCWNFSNSSYSSRLCKQFSSSSVGQKI